MGSRPLSKDGDAPFIHYILMLCMFIHVLLYHMQANSLHQSCLEKLPHVYNKSLWQTMKASMLIITDGVRVSSMSYGYYAMHIIISEC